MNPPNIDLTEAATQHFTDLLANETQKNLNLRIFVSYPGTPAAEVGITYCASTDKKATDLTIPYENFILYVDFESKDSLEKASIDYQTGDINGELIIKAPNLKKEKEPITPQGATLIEQVRDVIEREINPMLASHGGSVELLGIKAGVVQINFAGGCQGCAMSSMTVKNGIERTLKDQFPDQIMGIDDLTAHKEGATPYY
jgi:Fe/S biogenesis protein NfuA